mgnify:CR=1 FL=1
MGKEAGEPKEKIKRLTGFRLRIASHFWGIAVLKEARVILNKLTNIRMILLDILP